eukprot:COSAG02_NODE_776_length_17302_cov_17.765855_1_plen_1025_part_00
MEVTFTGDGKLGISFAGTGPSATPIIKAIKPEGLAAQYSDRLVPGLVLDEVNGQAVAELTFEQALALVTNATRPATLSFQATAHDDRARHIQTPASGSALSVTFSRPGSLGLKFVPIEAKRGLQLARVNPGTQATEHQALVEREAMTLALSEVVREDGESLGSGIENMSYEEGIEILKRAPRPVTLRFRSTRVGSKAQQLRAARNTRLAPVATNPGPPAVSGSDATEVAAAAGVPALKPSAAPTAAATAPVTRGGGLQQKPSGDKRAQAESKSEEAKEPARRRARIESVTHTVKCEGLVSKSSSKDPNSSKGKWKQYYFVLTTGRVSTLSWYKSVEHYTEQKSPVDKWLIVSCEAKFTDEASIPGEPIFTLSRLDMPSAIFMRCREGQAKRWVAKLSEAAISTPDLKQVLSNQSLRSLTDEEAESFRIGARVQVYSRTAGIWQMGEVTSHEPDGLIGVNYGDGFRTRKSVDPRDTDTVRRSSIAEEDTDEDGSQSESQSDASSKRSSLRLSSVEHDYLIPVEVVFTEPGSLGLSFASDSEQGKPWIKAIREDSQAARFPQLAVGLTLLSVDGEPVESLVDAVSKIQAAGRPAKLEFRRDDSFSAAELSVANFLSRVGCTDVGAVVKAFTSVQYAEATWVTELEQMLCSGDLGSFLTCLGAAHSVPKHTADEQASLFHAVLTDPGPLGITFGTDSDDGQPFIKAVKPGSQAAELPQLQVGLVLESIDGEAVESFADAILKLKQAGRPVTLVFRDVPEEQNWETAKQDVAGFLHTAGVAVRTSDVVEAFDAAGFLPSTWLPELQDMQARGELGAFLSSVAFDETESDPLRDVENFLSKIGMQHASLRVIDAFVGAGYESHAWVTELEDMEKSNDLDAFVASLVDHKESEGESAGQAVVDVYAFLSGLGVNPAGAGIVVDEFVKAGYGPATWLDEIKEMHEGHELVDFLASVGVSIDNDPAASALFAQLAVMKLSVLKKRARACGIDEEALEAADDADDIKAAVIRLIVRRENPITRLADDQVVGCT